MHTTPASPRTGEATPRAGVVGLGMIGSGVAISLARSGRVPAAVYDVRPDAADSLPGAPARVASPAEVARASDVVLVAVADAAQARDVIAGDDGILAGAHEGLVVALLSTVALDAVRALGASCAAHGVGFLDAGVTGGGRTDQNGLTVMVGGPDYDVAVAMPVLRDFARTVVHCGPLGAGMVTKLARNALTFSTWAAVREAASIAQAGGVPLDRLLAVLESADDEGTTPLARLTRMVAGAAVPPEQVDRVDALMQKDLAAAQAFAGSMGLEVPIVDVARPRMRAAYAGELPAPLPPPDDAHARGVAMMNRTYGSCFGDRLPAATDNPSLAYTVERLFAEVWARPYLTVRDRRLLTVGATAMLGRGDLLEVQLRGALANGELTDDQLRELALHLHYYAGWGNGTTVQRVVEQLVGERRLPRTRPDTRPA